MLRRFVIWYRGKWFDFRNCQHRCNEHGWGDGHSPVDMWHHYRDNYIYRR